jgi:hypothetical protein
MSKEGAKLIKITHIPGYFADGFESPFWNFG